MSTWLSDLIKTM